MSVSGKKRIEWIDMARGFCMLFVIIGHTLGNVSVEIGTSFVLPLLFIFSGMTGRFSDNFGQFTKGALKSAKKLLVPPIAVYLISVILSLVTRLINGTAVLSDSELAHPVNLIGTFLFQRCDDISLASVTIPQIGILWFFSTLYSLRLIFDLLVVILPKKILPVGVAVISVCGAILGYFSIPLPLNLDIAMTIVPFIYFGYLIGKILRDENLLKKYSSHPVFAFIISFILYAITFLICHYNCDYYFEIASSKYPLYPLCIAMACFGSVATIYGFAMISSRTTLLRPLGIIGFNTLYLYCIHSLDKFIKPIWSFTGNIYINALVRTVVDITIMCIFLYIRKSFKKR